MRGHTRQIGREGELIARKHLEQAGIRVLVANYRSRRGEIDLIGREGDTIVFCEVKYRAGRGYGSPEEAVTASKQRTIRAVAEEYLVRRNMHDQACRFDVVSVLSEGDAVTVNHIRNAF